MFFGVEPERHGITTNVWAPPVRPVVGLIEALHRAGRTCAFFYNWEQLRDLTPPGNWSASYYMSNVTDEGGTGDVEIAELAVARLKRSPVDFAFVYLGHTDEAGHLHGWMSAQYLAAIGNADRCISEVCRAAGEGANVIVTSDHGGHGKSHGTDMPEDILTPIVMWGPDVPAMGQLERQARITDIAPTILDLFGVPTPEEWIGASLLRGA
jgi:phosphopentomutase